MQNPGLSSLCLIEPTLLLDRSPTDLISDGGYLPRSTIVPFDVEWVEEQDRGGIWQRGRC